MTQRQKAQVGVLLFGVAGIGLFFARCSYWTCFLWRCSRERLKSCERGATRQLIDDARCSSSIVFSIPALALLACA